MGRRDMDRDSLFRSLCPVCMHLWPPTRDSAMGLEDEEGVDQEEVDIFRELALSIKTFDNKVVGDI